MDGTSCFGAGLPQGLQGRHAPPPSAEQHRLAGDRGRRALALAGAVVMACLASPTVAAPEARTKLVQCGAQSCLRITGHREDPALTVAINGHPVPVEGKHRWHADLPLDVVREWSPPYARTIEVSLHHPETQYRVIASIDLPIGLLGHSTDLASLVVSLR